MIIKKIEQVQQEPSGCAAACMAMLTDLPLKQVMEEFHNLYWESKITTANYLRSKGVLVVVEPKVTDSHALYSDAIHLLVVPSLGSAAGFHNIVADSRGGVVTVLDPAKGTGPTTRYYVMPDAPELDVEREEYDPLAYPLLTWFTELVVCPQ